jgi:hypothetical protein
MSRACKCRHSRLRPFRRAAGGIAEQPILDDVMVELLRPEQAGVGAPGDEAFTVGKLGGQDGLVERVALRSTLGEDLLEAGDVDGADLVRTLQPQAEHARTARGKHDLEPCRRLRPDELGVHRLGPSADHPLVECILHVRAGVGRPMQADMVGLVLGEEQRRSGQLAEDFPPVASEGQMLAVDLDLRDRPHPRPRCATFVVAVPGPGVAEPERRQEMDRRFLRPGVDDLNADEQFLHVGLGVLHGHVEAAVAVEDPGVGEFELRGVLAAAPVLFDELGVGELRLRIPVEGAGVGMGGGGVEVEPGFLDVLTVVAFGVGEAEEAFLEDRVAAVPKGRGEAQPALAVGKPEQAVLAPAVGTAAGMVVREVLPAGAVLRIVFADGGPLAVGQIGAPALPVRGAKGVLGETLALGGLTQTFLAVG